MAAQEQERERVVLLVEPVHAGGRQGLEQRLALLAPRAPRVAAQPVHEPPVGHSQQPAEGFLGNLSPCQMRLQQRLLDGVLAAVEVPVTPDEHAQDARCLLAQLQLDRRARGHRAELMSSHSSIPPPSGPIAG